MVSIYYREKNKERQGRRRTVEGRKMECNFNQAVKNHLTEKIHEQKFEGGAGANKTILMSGARASAKAL